MSCIIEKEKDKLGKLCLHFRIPSLYRILAWKILLGLLPTCQEAWQFCEEQRRVQAENLQKAAHLIFGTNPFEVSEDKIIQMTLIHNGLGSFFHKVKT